MGQRGLLLHGGKVYEPIEGKLVQFRTRDGLELEGFLVAPKSASKCIVFIHGMEGNFHESPLPMVIAEQARKTGMALFSIDTRGHDLLANITRAVKKKQSNYTGGTGVEKFEDSALDIEAAVAALKRMGFDSFVLCGHSTGCQKAAYYQHARKSKSVSGIVLLGPVSDYEDERRSLGSKFENKFRIAKAAAAKGAGNEFCTRLAMHYSPNRFLSIADLSNVEARLFDYDGELLEFGSITVPVLAVFGSNDRYIYAPAERYIKRLRKATRSKHFEGLVMKGANHGFEGREEEVAATVCRFAAACK